MNAGPHTIELHKTCVCFVNAYRNNRMRFGRIANESIKLLFMI